MADVQHYIYCPYGYETVPIREEGVMEMWVNVYSKEAVGPFFPFKVVDGRLERHSMIIVNDPQFGPRPMEMMLKELYPVQERAAPITLKELDATWATFYPIERNEMPEAMITNRIRQKLGAMMLGSGIIMLLLWLMGRR